jgi:hypothetical protein
MLEIIDYIKNSKIIVLPFSGAKFLQNLAVFFKEQNYDVSVINEEDYNNDFGKLLGIFYDILRSSLLVDPRQRRLVKVMVIVENNIDLEDESLKQNQPTNQMAINYKFFSWILKNFDKKFILFNGLIITDNKEETINSMMKHAIINEDSKIDMFSKKEFQEIIMSEGMGYISAEKDVRDSMIKLSVKR